MSEQLTAGLLCTLQSSAAKWQGIFFLMVDFFHTNIREGRC